LDRDVAPFVQPTLAQVAEDFPQAMVYPVSAASKGFSFSRNEIGRKNKRFFKK